MRRRVEKICMWFWQIRPFGNGWVLMVRFYKAVADRFTSNPRLATMTPQSCLRGLSMCNTTHLPNLVSVWTR